MPGFERYALGLALLAPVMIVSVVFGQLPIRAAFDGADSAPPVVSRRPASSVPQPPPTLVPVAIVPHASEGAPNVAPTPTPTGRYTVQPGDQLKHIAAEHGVSIWNLIDANALSDPDSLKVGQVLTIPRP